MSASFTDQPLPDSYRDLMASCIDEEGVSIAHGIVIDAAGEMTMLALAVPPMQAYKVMLGQWLRGAREMIFALDRFTKPGQGTTLGDLLAGHHFVAGVPPRPFIIEYQHDPRIVKPIDWHNAFWNRGLIDELTAAVKDAGGSVELVKDVAL